jgi:hypothetical protein
MVREGKRKGDWEDFRLEDTIQRGATMAAP